MTKDKLRAISDFISGMPDRYAINLYNNYKCGNMSDQEGTLTTNFYYDGVRPITPENSDYPSDLAYPPWEKFGHQIEIQMVDDSDSILFGHSAESNTKWHFWNIADTCNNNFCNKWYLI